MGTNKTNENKKRIVKKKYDDKEDLEISYFASSNPRESFLTKFFFCLLLIMIGVVLGKYFIYNNKGNLNEQIKTEDKKIIKIKSYSDNILISNNGVINEEINDELVNNKPYIIEKVNYIELKSDKSDENNKIYYDVKFNITTNEFTPNNNANDSDVLVKFAYSYDNKNWEYINNVISTSNSTIKPLMGRSYDISGIIDNLKVATNMELNTKNDETKRIYWKAELTFRNKKNKEFNNKFNANFIIEYKNI